MLLGREPDPVGLRDGIRMFQEGRSLDDVIRWCLGSHEFGARYKEFLRTYVQTEFLDPADRVDVDTRQATGSNMAKEPS